ncbi:MAG: UDP-glucose 4-epimerase GalE [Chloroflexota bacterium]
MTILVTGGAGYIGSHTCVALLQAGYDVVVVDNLYNSKEEALRRVQEITGKTLTFHKVDLLDRPALETVFAQHKIDAVIHFAALKAVGESVSRPLDYYHNNITGTIYLCETMAKHGVKNLVFSSSATVYGEDNQPPLVETMRTSATNPYGWTKVMMEQVFRDWHVAVPDTNIIMLRYFNPVGAHASGRIGEDPNGVPLNLLPFVTQVAVGIRASLKVFGNDYPTPDGTCLRDYIHVVDLALGHVRAIEKLAEKPGVAAYNLGTGRPNSVLEVIQTFERVTGVKIAYEIVERRPGDLPTSFADPAKANRELNWQATHSLEEMCADAWRWQSNNPKGYE